jgi:hypothetical protein
MDVPPGNYQERYSQMPGRQKLFLSAAGSRIGGRPPAISIDLNWISANRAAVCYNRSMMMVGRPLRLPDDVEQFLIDGQETRAISVLMHRRWITLDQARTLVGRWLFEWESADWPGEAQ